MLKRLLLGAIAGAVATVPQSGVVWGFRKLGIYHSKPAPEAIAEATTRPLAEPHLLPDPVMAVLKTGQLFSFGASVGAVFSLLAVVIRPTALTGLLMGLGVWKAGYDGVIPAMGILPPPDQDETGRAVTMVVAHVAYGVALGTILGWLTTRSRLR